jgi:hypothetical protein
VRHALEGVVQPAASGGELACVDERDALVGIVFVLRTGISRNELPTALVACSEGLVGRGCGQDRRRRRSKLHEQLA